MPKILCPMVGMWHRKPAGLMVRFLSVGTPLILRPEPNNPVDPNAIGVHVFPTDLPEDDPELWAAIGKAYTKSEFLAFDTFQLGFVPATDALDFQIAGFPKDDVRGTFVILASGKPGVKFEFGDPR